MHLPAAAEAPAEFRTKLAQAATTGAAIAVAKPPAPDEREAAYMSRMDKVVAPLLDYQLSTDDLAKLKEAVKAIAGSDAAKVKELQAGITDPLARQLIEWLRLRRGQGQAADYLKFLAENPQWPSREILQRRMEETLFEEGGDTERIATYFKDGAARSPAGMAVLASVHLAHGEKGEAKALAAKIWREEDLPETLEKGFLSRFGSMLGAEDHKWRLDRLLVEDVRYKVDRVERAASVKRVIALLPAADQKVAQARLAVFMRKSDGKTALGPAQKGTGTDWGIVFHKIQHHRRAGHLDEAAKLMRSAPLDPLLVTNLDKWWFERRGLAYLALKADKAKLAYELVRDAGPVGVNAANDQTFMAGWIALRYLKDAKDAEKHFATLLSNADGPLTRARANYWMGRALEAQGNKDRARASYETAAQFKDTFHGLLAVQKLSPGTHELKFDAPALPAPEQSQRFLSTDAVKALALARKADLERHVTRVFLLNAAKIENDEAWAAMAAHLARATGDTQTSVRIGKAAIAAGHNLVYYSYPVHALPKYTPLRKPPETAYLLGLARQETEFNSDTVSGAGARGILQVMKVTANHVCRDYKIKCQHSRLLTDSSYNTMIASAYVADRLDEWDGSYVLGLPSYNAGPGRTREWVKEFGDPRQTQIDPIDWIERIPFEETRNYVAKVLSNIQVYRARLGEKSPLRLDQDLYRARAASASPDAANAAKTSTADSRD
ncbi:MAG: lytic transglycosylase domain-containing protein [Hyphomicrobium sp.]